MPDHWGNDDDRDSVRVIDREKEDQKEKIGPPKMYNVVMLNDDFTTMDFVVDILRKFFGKGEQEAAGIMLEIHKNGKGIAGTYSKDIAETKAKIANEYAQSQEYPFHCSVEVTG